MTLRVSLIIDGDATGAKKAADEATRAINSVVKGTGGTAVAAQGVASGNRAIEDSSRRAAGAIDTANRSSGSLRMTFRTLAREAALTGGPLGGMISQVGVLAIGSSRLGIAITVGTLAIAASAAVAYKAAAAYAALEDQQAKAAGALIVTKNASGQTIASLEALARELSASGTQSIEDIRAAEAELLKYKAVGGDAFGQVLKAAKDLAGSGFADLKSATAAIATALQDPTKATEALAGVGLKLSVAEQRLASDLYAAGKAAQAQQVILKAVTAQVQGADAPAANTLSAAWNRVTQSGSSVLEQWGKQISEGLRLKDVLNGIANAAPGAAGAIEAAANQATLRELARRNRAGTLAPDGGLPTRGDRTGVPSFDQRFAPAVTSPLNKDFIERKKRIDEVNDALLLESRTAGMSAVQQEVYNLAVKAGIVGDEAATRAIGAKVNAIHALNETRQITDQIKGQTAATVAEAASLNMTGAAAAAYRMEQEALAQARLKNITLSPAQLAAIRKESDAYRAAGENLADLKLQKDIGFERSQLGRTDSEQEVFNRLNAAGLLQNGQIASAAAQATAQELRLNQALASTKGLVTDVVSGFAKDFRNALEQGATKWEAFKQAGVNALGKISDKLIDIATQQLVSKAFGAAIGSFGGSLSLGNAGGTAGALAAVHHSGYGPGDRITHGRVAFPADFKNAPRLHSGIGPGERPAIIRDDESVLTPGQMRALGGARSAAPVINIYPVAGSTADVKQNDDGSFDIVGRMIDDKLKSYDRRLPDRVHAIGLDPRAR
jgi:hypothetical protein